MLKAFRGKCHHCGHDHDEEDAAPTPPASAPAKGRVTVTEEMVERALRADYRDIDWQYGTIEEALQACHPHVVRGWMRAALVTAIGEGESWVKCSERMPEPMHYVLGWCPERRMAFQAHFTDGKWTAIGGDRVWPEITHWMETPRMSPPSDHAEKKWNTP